MDRNIAGGNTTGNTALAEVSVPTDLPEQVKEVVHPLGLTPEDAIMLFYRYCANPATTDKAQAIIRSWF